MYTKIIKSLAIYIFFLYNTYCKEILAKTFPEIERRSAL